MFGKGKKTQERTEAVTKEEMEKNKAERRKKQLKKRLKAIKTVIK